jgi:hypothetical protein
MFAHGLVSLWGEADIVKAIGETRRLLCMLEKFVNSHVIKIFIFSAMMITSGIEVFESVTELGTSHGILLFSTFHMLKGFYGFYGAKKMIKR